jgi:hypothetical protein
MHVNGTYANFCIFLHPLFCEKLENLPCSVMQVDRYLKEEKNQNTILSLSKKFKSYTIEFCKNLDLITDGDQSISNQFF